MARGDAGLCIYILWRTIFIFHLGWSMDYCCWCNFFAANLTCRFALCMCISFLAWLGLILFRRTCLSCSHSFISLLVPMLMETTILVQHSPTEKIIEHWNDLLVSEEHIRSISSCSITISTMCSHKGLGLQRFLVFYGTKVFCCN